jgi:hypothetical protein
MSEEPATLDQQYRDVTMIRKLPSGQYRLYSRTVDPRTGKHKNLGTFSTLEAAERHEREVQFFKRRSKSKLGA